MAKKSYVVQNPIKYDGNEYSVGKNIELEDKEAENLRAIGAISEAVADKNLAPTDEAERIAAIATAIGQLDVANPALWTSGGAPKTEGLTAITGWPVAAKDRDAAWAELQKNSAQS